MKQILHTFIVLLSLFSCGCEKHEYTIHMKYDGDKIIRKIVCPSNNPKGIHTELQKLYPNQIDPNSYEGTFRENLPDDVGGFGRNFHMSNPMGEAYIYVERFRGNDAQADDIEKALSVSDHSIDLLLDWLEFELGNHNNFSKLKAFCNDSLREDVKNLVVYLWLGSRTHQYDEKDMAARMLLYLYERNYFTFDDISNVAASHDPEALALTFLRKLISQKLECYNSEQATKQLAFLRDPKAVEQSLSRFLKSPMMYEQILQVARKRSAEPDLVIDPNYSEDYEQIAGFFFEEHEIEAETFFIPSFLFGWGIGKVYVKLDCPRKPFETNGEWDEENKTVSWSGSITDEMIPFMCYATIGKPNDEFQKKHFGRVILKDEELVEYSFWYKGLKEEQRGEWDKFLVSVDPNQELEGRVESFRFKNVPPGPPDSDGKVRLISDMPRKLVVEGLKMNENDQQND